VLIKLALLVGTAGSSLAPRYCQRIILLDLLKHIHQLRGWILQKLHLRSILHL